MVAVRFSVFGLQLVLFCYYNTSFALYYSCYSLSYHGYVTDSHCVTGSVGGGDQDGVRTLPNEVLRVGIRTVVRTLPNEV